MYVKINNGQVDTFPYSVGMLRKDNPNTSFPKMVTEELLDSFGLYKVVRADDPSYNPATEKLVQDAEPSLVDGVWTLSKTVVAMSEEEQTRANERVARDNRGTRNLLIAETDWWAVADRTMTAEQTAYRQALRDITSHANWPHLEDADWPTKP